MGKSKVTSEPKEGQPQRQGDMDFDVESFKNGEFNELKALAIAVVRLQDNSEAEEHWALCWLLQERICKVDKYLGQVAFGDETD
jgi:hypothetical protein